MTIPSSRAVGRRLAATRRARHMTQAHLAQASSVSLSMVRKIEQGSRVPGDAVLDALGAALAVDPTRLIAGGHSTGRVHDMLPALSAAIVGYDVPDDGSVRSLPQLQAAVDETTQLRLRSQYTRLARSLPGLLMELCRAHHTMTGRDQLEVSALLSAAFRAADAVAFKHGALDLSARLIELMRWASERTGDHVLVAVAAYVRTEVFFAARAHAAGLRALESALDKAPLGNDPRSISARGALHMRAAVIAARGGDANSASQHLSAARSLADDVEEGVYCGTAFGPSSVRMHEISVAVSLGGDHAANALAASQTWTPPASLPAERRSGFYIELARAQLWRGQRDTAFESLKAARRIAPQHTREHPWVRDDTATLLRLNRAPTSALTSFAEWANAV